MPVRFRPSPPLTLCNRGVYAHGLAVGNRSPPESSRTASNEGSIPFARSIHNQRLMNECSKSAVKWLGFLAGDANCLRLFYRGITAVAVSRFLLSPCATSNATTSLHSWKVRACSSTPSHEILETVCAGIKLQIWRKMLKWDRAGLLILFFMPAVWQGSNRQASA
jgi:hypothetical protein